MDVTSLSTRIQTNEWLKKAGMYRFLIRSKNDGKNWLGMYDKGVLVYHNRKHTHNIIKTYHSHIPYKIN